MCSVAEFETFSTAESMWFPGVSLSDVSVSFRCFDWMAILSGCSGYILSSARGTENFIIISHRCGNRRTLERHTFIQRETHAGRSTAFCS